MLKFLIYIASVFVMWSLLAKRNRKKLRESKSLTLMDVLKMTGSVILIFAPVINTVAIFTLIALDYKYKTVLNAPLFNKKGSDWTLDD